jgi:hypothetical protein
LFDLGIVCLRHFDLKSDGRLLGSERHKIECAAFFTPSPSFLHNSIGGISLSKRKTTLAHSSRVEGRSVSRAIWRQLGNLYNITGLCQNLQRTLAWPFPTICEMQAKTLVRRNFFTSLTSPPIIGLRLAVTKGMLAGC